MHFTTEQGDDKTVFRLKEPRLDSRNAGQLKAEFLILSQPDIDALIVDLTAVEHIDSAGISALLLAQRQMKIHDGEVRLVGLRPDVLAMLRLTQLDRIFAIFNTVEAALAAELSIPDDDDDLEHDPGFRDSDFENDDELELSLGARTLGPSAPSANDIKAGAIAAGGSFGAAALSKIMMTPYDDELLTTNAIAEDDFDAEGSASGAFLLGGLDGGAHSPILSEDEDFADDDDDLEDDDDLDDDDVDDEDEAEDLDEEDDADAEDVAEVAEEDILEDDDFEDDDLDDEELEEDEDEDF